MKKRVILALAVLLAAALLLTGCEPAGKLGINGTYIAKTEATENIPAIDVLKIVITDETAIFYSPTAEYLASVVLCTAQKALGNEPSWPASDWMTSGVNYGVSVNGLAVTFTKAGISIPATLSSNRREITFTYEGASITCKK